MKHSFLYALTSTSFRFLFIAEMFTMISVHFFTLYLIYLIFYLTNSNSAVAGIMLTFTLPAILFGVIAGIYVDKKSKKYALIGSNLVRAILLISLLIFSDNLFIIFAVSFLFFTVTQFFVPAETPIIPLIVKKDMLLSANALFGFGMYGSLLIAFLMVGPAIIFLQQWEIIVMLITFLGIGVVCLLPLKQHARRTESTKAGSYVYTSALKDEFRDIYKLLTKKRKIKSSILLLAMSQVIIILLAALAPGFASTVLNVDIKTFPLLLISPAAIGVFIGAILVVYLTKYADKQNVINIGLIFSSLSLFILSLSNYILNRNFVESINAILPASLQVSTIHIVIITAFVLGISNSFVFIPSNTNLLENTIDRVRGKIYGIISTMVGVLSIVPLIIAGSFSDIIGVNNVLMGISFVLFLIAITHIYLTNKL